MSNANEVNVLKLTLHEQLVGYVAGFQNGRNVLSFADSFRNNPVRPTFSLITHPDFPMSDKFMSSPLAKNQRLHPTLSNLLPEGALRSLIANTLKVHSDNEFQMLSYLGRDLPGALVAEPMAPEDVPDKVLNTHGSAQAIKFEDIDRDSRFSLAGVQMKFSMRAQADRYTLPSHNALGDWIIKTPSTIHKDVPFNEYTAMRLAELAGVDIPEIKLVELSKLDNLPPINLPNETHAFAIKRFDRDDDNRIHSEDFAQILVKYPNEKYSAGNYEQIAKILKQYAGDGGLKDAQQFTRRLLVNILLANGDAHLKNWSLYYPDQVTPQLSPAYDIVTTKVYIPGERQFALNLGKNKDWYQASFAHFETLAKRADLPWRHIKPHLDDTLLKARTLWPDAFKELPMNEQHKQQLKEHWGMLHKDFQI